MRFFTVVVLTYSVPHAIVLCCVMCLARKRGGCGRISALGIHLRCVAAEKRNRMRRLGCEVGRSAAFGQTTTRRLWTDVCRSQLCGVFFVGSALAPIHSAMVMCDALLDRGSSCVISRHVQIKNAVLLTDRERQLLRSVNSMTFGGLIGEKSEKWLYLILNIIDQ